MVELLQMEGNGIQMKHQEPDSKVKQLQIMLSLDCVVPIRS